MLSSWTHWRMLWRYQENRIIKRLQDTKRKQLGDIYHPKTHTYKQVIKYLSQEAGEVKRAHAPPKPPRHLQQTRFEN